MKLACPTVASKWHKLAVQQDLVLVCYGSVSHLDNRMSCFVSHNDASTSIWPVWSMNFNNSTLWEALLSRLWRDFQDAMTLVRFTSKITCTPLPRTSPSLGVSARPMESTPTRLRHPC